MVNTNSKLTVIRGIPLNQDSRTVRHMLLDYSTKESITWEDEGPKKFFFYTGRRQYPIIISYLIWIFRLFFLSLIKFRKGGTVICMDLDTYIPVFLGSIFGRAEIYLDIVDPISQTRFRNTPMNIIFDWCEFLLLCHSHRVILPGIKRVDFYLDRLHLSQNWHSRVNPPIIIENVSYFSKKDRGQSIKERKQNKSKAKKTIGYFGGLSDSRGLRELCEHFAGNPNFDLLIAGSGSFENELRRLSEEHANITFTGPYVYSELSFLISSVDFYWAYYSPSILLHRYAYPNKFYEHLAFHVPIIINKCVPQSIEVNKLKTGIVIDDILSSSTFLDLEKTIFNFDPEHSDFLEWERKYENYNFGLDK